jgi:bifunctional NMN adenylyltransferase/nudix hydrolase
MLAQSLEKLGLNDKVTIDSIEDHPISNELWSEELDKKIAAHKETFPDLQVRLYGSRDSFIKCYFGVHQNEVIPEVPAISGTDMRNQVLTLPSHDLTDAHREGMIYGLKNVYPVGMAVVDIAVYKKVGNNIYFLLGRKPRETVFRLFGGFFDVSVDGSLEEAALRELREEAGDIKVTAPVYLTSTKIDDWRYRDNAHKIVTSLFIVEYISGEPAPSDDIVELKWVKREDIATTAATALASRRR